MILTIKIRKKFKINRHNLRRLNSSKLRKNRTTYVYVNYFLFAIRIDNNENDDKLRNNFQFYFAN
jgi:hypothetical protein